jgi:hypothetical protein
LNAIHAMRFDLVYSCAWAAGSSSYISQIRIQFEVEKKEDGQPGQTVTGAHNKKYSFLVEELACV